MTWGTFIAAYLAFSGWIATAALIHDSGKDKNALVSMIAGLLLYPFNPLVVIVHCFSGSRK